jgi:hypothetical protein
MSRKCASDKDRLSIDGSKQTGGQVGNYLFTIIMKENLLQLHRLSNSIAK